MDIALKVAERYRLAIRVAERTKAGGAIGDPKELFATYKHHLVKFASVEGMAKEFLTEWAELHDVDFLAKELSSSGTTSPERKKELYLPNTKKGIDIRSVLKYQGFTALQPSAQLLCLSLLQQLVLPPKVRKSVEVASKFWMRNARLNPKGKSYEESLKIGVEMYQEHLELFRKYEKLFETAIREGKPHSDTGEVITRFKAGMFTVVNTGGFDTDLMLSKAKLIDEAAQKMEGIGLGKVCYGDVLITNRLSGESTQAFYLPSKDEMFVRADAKVTLDAVRVVCHELTHRLESKFLAGQKQAIVALFRKINIHSDVSEISPKDFPKIGDQVKVPKYGLCEVSDYDLHRQSVKVKMMDLEPGERAVTLSMPITSYNEFKGVPKPPKHPMEFITSYAKRGGPSENFAEMVSFYAIGQLPKEQVELLLPIIS